MARLILLWFVCTVVAATAAVTISTVFGLSDSEGFVLGLVLGIAAGLVPLFHSAR